MKFKFKIQQYQTDAVESTVSVFAGQPSKTNAQYRRDLGKQKQQLKNRNIQRARDMGKEYIPKGF